MTDDDLLQAILANPDDDEPRLVYADQLCSRGDPRGELIHVQVRLEQMRDDDPNWIPLARRERELLVEHRATWLEPVTAEGWVRGTLRRGFIDEVSGYPEDLAVALPELVAREPVRSVIAQVITPEEVRRVTSNPAMSRIRRLAIDDRYEIPQEPSELGDSIGSIATSPVLAALTEVEIHGVHFGWSGFHELVHSPRFDQIQELGLLGCGIDARHVAEIVGRNPDKLTRLELWHNRRIGTSRWAKLESLSNTRIRALDLSYTGLTDGHLASLVDKLPPLEELELDDEEIYSGGIEALSSASALTGLRHLDLGSIWLGEWDIERLGRAFPSLESLGLSCAASSIPALAKARWPLRRLVLYDRAGHHLSAVAAAFERLTVLHLSSANHGDIEAIAAASWPSLHTLMLAGSSDLDDRGALLLAEAAGLRSDLALLDVRHTKITEHGLAALRERFGPAVAYGEFLFDDEDDSRRRWR